MSSMEDLLVKVLGKQISLYTIRGILEVCVPKNPTALGVGVSGKGRNCYVFTLRQIKEILKYCPNIDVLYLKDSNSFILKNSK